MCRSTEIFPMFLRFVLPFFVNLQYLPEVEFFDLSSNDRLGFVFEAAAGSMLRVNHRSFFFLTHKGINAHIERCRV